MGSRNHRGFTLVELVSCVVVVAVLVSIAAVRFKAVAARAEDTVASHALAVMAHQGYLLAVLDSHDRFALAHFDAALADFNGAPQAAAPGVFADTGFVFRSASTAFGEVSRGVTVNGGQAALVMRTGSGSCAAAHVDMAGTLVSYAAPAAECSAQWLLAAAGSAPSPAADPPPEPVPPPSSPPGTLTTVPPAAPEPAEPAPGAGFGGFEAPVQGHPLLNAANAGQAIPLRFSLGGDFGLDVFASGSPHAQVIDCESRTALGDPVPAAAPGESGLSYSEGAGRYQWVWKTQRSWAGSCVRLLFEFADGTAAFAYFSFTGPGPGR